MSSSSSGADSAAALYARLCARADARARFPTLNDYIVRAERVPQSEVDERIRWWGEKHIQGLQEWLAPFFVAREEELAVGQAAERRRKGLSGKKGKFPRVCTRLNALTGAMPPPNHDCGGALCICVLCGSDQHGCLMRVRTANNSDGNFQPGAAATTSDGPRFVCEWRNAFARELEDFLAHVQPDWDEHTALEHIDAMIEWRRTQPQSQLRGPLSLSIASSSSSNNNSSNAGSASSSSAAVPRSTMGVPAPAPPLAAAVRVPVPVPVPSATVRTTTASPAVPIPIPAPAPAVPVPVSAPAAAPLPLSASGGWSTAPTSATATPVVAVPMKTKALAFAAPPLLMRPAATTAAPVITPVAAVPVPSTAVAAAAAAAAAAAPSVHPVARAMKHAPALPFSSLPPPVSMPPGRMSVPPPHHLVPVKVSLNRVVASFAPPAHLLATQQQQQQQQPIVETAAAAPAPIKARAMAKAVAPVAQAPLWSSTGAGVPAGGMQMRFPNVAPVPVVPVGASGAARSLDAVFAPPPPAAVSAAGTGVDGASFFGLEGGEVFEHRPSAELANFMAQRQFQQQHGLPIQPMRINVPHQQQQQQQQLPPSSQYSAGTHYQPVQQQSQSQTGFLAPPPQPQLQQQQIYQSSYPTDSSFAAQPSSTAALYAPSSSSSIFNGPPNAYGAPDFVQPSYAQPSYAQLPQLHPQQHFQPPPPQQQQQHHFQTAADMFATSASASASAPSSAYAYDDGWMDDAQSFEAQPHAHELQQQLQQAHSQSYAAHPSNSAAPSAAADPALTSSSSFSSSSLASPVRVPGGPAVAHSPGALGAAMVDADVSLTMSPGAPLPPARAPMPASATSVQPADVAASVSPVPVFAAPPEPVPAPAAPAADAAASISPLPQQAVSPAPAPAPAAAPAAPVPATEVAASASVVSPSHVASPSPPAAAASVAAEIESSVAPVVVVPAVAAAAAAVSPAPAAPAAPAAAAAVASSLPTASQQIVRVRVFRADGPAKGEVANCDSFAELLSDLEFDPDTEVCFSLTASTEEQPEPTPITEPEFWALAKNTPLYAYTPKPVPPCKAPFEVQQMFVPNLKRTDTCRVCGRLLSHPSHG